MLFEVVIKCDETLADDRRSVYYHSPTVKAYSLWSIVETWTLTNSTAAYTYNGIQRINNLRKKGSIYGGDNIESFPHEGIANRMGCCRVGSAGKIARA